MSLDNPWFATMRVIRQSSALENADMDINRFTQKSQEALQAAQQRAARAGHQQVDVEHLLTSLLEQESGLALSILRKTEINVDSLKRRLEQELSRLPRVSGPSGDAENVYITGRLNRLLS